MPMRLGAMIDMLKAMPQHENVFYDFGNIEPTTLDSYRGYYDQLALGYNDDGSREPITVATLLADCEQAVGRTYSGYKGGDYTMDRATPVWVANYGRSNSTAIVGIREVSYGVVIDTRFED